MDLSISFTRQILNLDLDEVKFKFNIVRNQ